MTRPWLLILGLLLGQGSAGWAAHNADLLRLLRGETCRGCRLSDADLVHADLRDVDLQQAHLQRLVQLHQREQQQEQGNDEARRHSRECTRDV